MTEIRPRRSVLSMPGSNARALEEARTFPADVIMIDLAEGSRVRFGVPGQPENASRGVIPFRSRRVERLHAAEAARTLAMADAIAALSA